MTFKGIKIKDTSPENLMRLIDGFVREHTEWSGTSKECIDFLQQRNWCTKKGEPIQNLDAVVSAYFQKKNRKKMKVKNQDTLQKQYNDLYQRFVNMGKYVVRMENELKSLKTEVENLRDDVAKSVLIAHMYELENNPTPGC